MKGIILAGGLGTRLRPLTLVANKHTLPIYDRPMAYHIVGYLRDANITNIMLITGRECCGDLIGLLGSGRDLGVELTFRVQEDADGIAGALKLCKDWAQGENVVVILGDNLLEQGIKPLVDKYRGSGAQISVIEVHDPQRFGVATLDTTGKVVNLVEKPKNPESNLAVIGVYVYDKQVWNIIPRLTPSARGEYEITDINKEYMKQGDLYCEKIDGWWTDAGTIESMFEATILMRKLQKGEK
jgi:glucose-1-phosphate thymidylyltransferase